MKRRDQAQEYEEEERRSAKFRERLLRDMGARNMSDAKWLKLFGFLHARELKLNAHRIKFIDAEKIHKIPQIWPVNRKWIDSRGPSA